MLTILRINHCSLLLMKILADVLVFHVYCWSVMHVNGNASVFHVLFLIPFCLKNTF